MTFRRGPGRRERNLHFITASICMAESAVSRQQTRGDPDMSLLAGRHYSLLLHAALCLDAWYSVLGAVECWYLTSSVDTDAIQAMTDVVFGIPEILRWPKCSRLISGCFLLSEIIIKSFSVLFTSPVSGGEWRRVLALCSVLQLWHHCPSAYNFLPNQLCFWTRSRLLIHIRTKLPTNQKPINKMGYSRCSV